MRLTFVLDEHFVDHQGGIILFAEVPQTVTGHQQEILIAIQWYAYDIRNTADNLFESIVADGAWHRQSAVDTMTSSDDHHTAATVFDAFLLRLARRENLKLE